MTIENPPKTPEEIAQEIVGNIYNKLWDQFHSGKLSSAKDYVMENFPADCGEDTVDTTSMALKPPAQEDSAPDMVNEPPHYTSHPSGIECIQVTEHMNFNLGNAVKYIWRCGNKGKPIEDLKKAVFYVNREIQRLQSGQ